MESSVSMRNIGIGYSQLGSHSLLDSSSMHESVEDSLTLVSEADSSLELSLMVESSVKVSSTELSSFSTLSSFEDASVIPSD